MDSYCSGSCARRIIAARPPTSPALAGVQKEFAAFADCPVNSPGVVTCIRSTTTSGEFKIGLKTVPINKPVILQGGLTENSCVLVPATDGNTLSKTSLQVPGGIIGIEALGPLTEVSATSVKAEATLPELGRRENHKPGKARDQS